MHISKVKVTKLTYLLLLGADSFWEALLDPGSFLLRHPFRYICYFRHLLSCWDNLSWLNVLISTRMPPYFLNLTFSRLVLPWMLFLMNLGVSSPRRFFLAIQLFIAHFSYVFICSDIFLQNCFIFFRFYSFVWVFFHRFEDRFSLSLLRKVSFIYTTWPCPSICSSEMSTNLFHVFLSVEFLF